VTATTRLGLALGALFGWLLSFPLFGPALFGVAPGPAPQLGLLFLFSHGAGMLLLHPVPYRLATDPRLLRMAGGLLALFTLLFAFALPFPAAATLFVLMGLLAALLVLAWAPSYVAGSERITPLAIGMAGANLIVAMAGLPPAPFTLPLLAALALSGAVLLPAPPPERPGALAAPLNRAQLLALLLPMGAFALADYFVGGLWYGTVTATFATGWAWQPAAEALFSAVSIALLARLVRRPGPGILARYSLSLMGLGLVLAATGQWVPLFRGLLLMGLVAGDLFYWAQLGTAGAIFGARRAYGGGLGLSLCLIGLANLTAGLSPGGPTGPGPTFLLAGAALLFLVLPLVYRLPVPPLPPAAEPPPEPAGQAHAAAALQSAPPNLTPTERQVYELLVMGASDGEIADELVVTRHTVKFHVRNILHKLGVANRKALLSSLVVKQSEKRP